MRSLERQLITAELRQRSEEGCDVHEISSRVEAALANKSSNADLVKLYDELMTLPIDPSFPYSEPSGLDDIRIQRPTAQRKTAFKLRR